MRSGIRLGCALMATLLPLACLTRITGLSFSGGIGAWEMAAVGTYALCALALGSVILLKGGWRPVLGSIGVAVLGFSLGASVDDPFLMAVPMVVAPLAAATLVLSPQPGDDGADAAGHATADDRPAR